MLVLHFYRVVKDTIKIDILHNELAKGAIGSLAFKSISIILNFAISVLLARSLNPEGFGIYVFTFSVMSVLGTPVLMGLPTLVVREVAKYHLLARYDLIRGLLTRCNQAVLGLSLVIAVAAGVVAWCLSGIRYETQLLTLAWALILLPLAALNQLREAALQGLRRVLQGQLPDMIIQPGLFLLFIGIAALRSTITPPQAMALYCTTSLIAFGVGFFLLLRELPTQVRSTAASYETNIWARSVLPLSLISGLQIINGGQTAFLILGVLATKEQVGLFRVAFSYAALPLILLCAADAVLAPHISRLYNMGNISKLQRLLTRSVRIVLLMAAPLFGIIIFWGDVIIGFIYGNDYRACHYALIILCIGQLINVATGSNYTILNMAGHERSTLKGAVFAAAINVVLNAALIPFFGLNGAAAAFAASTVAVNLFLRGQVWARLGLQSAAFGRTK